MRHAYALFLLGFVAAPAPVLACSCFGPDTFCETLNPQPPQFPDPQWWVPDHVVLGVKLASVEYGADLKVVQDFSGGLAADAIVRVWGDCGFLCRMYVDGVADGDTVLWAIQDCDLSGNWGCGASLEEPEHFQLSVCGVYWLGYANGLISGPLYTAGATETIGLEDFGALVSGCLSTGVQDAVDEEVEVRYADGQLLLSTGTTWAEAKQVGITDAVGRLLLETGFRGHRGAVPLPTSMHGALCVRVTDQRRSYVARVLVR